MNKSSRLNEVLVKIDSNQPQALERLFELLRIPSISTDQAYAKDCSKAADWMVSELASLGFDASARPTPGHPMVVAHSPRDDGPDAPRKILFYGHYDVQPVDPLELWDAPPFEPRLEDGDDGKVIRARGASDDKGQLMTFIEACRAWRDTHGALPANISILLEGEEESGSPSLDDFLEANKDELSLDLALICDTDLYSDGRPAITTQLRGLMAEEITVNAADRDLHSGMYGGVAANPIQILANALSTVKDENGNITLPGFYDDVPELPDALRKDWEALNFDGADFLAKVGLKDVIGEKDRTALEMIWARPTFEINGISGGYTGEGFKTVLPAKAHAKISFRLTGNQDPDKIRAAFRAHIESLIPKDCSVTFKGHGNSRAGHMDITDPAFTLAKAALTDEWGREAAFTGSGGSIPIAGNFKHQLGMDTMLIGFARDDDRIHSPNEKYDVRSFHKGTRSWARIIAALR